MSTAPAHAHTHAQPFIWGTGRRKTAVARVRIREGTGALLINDTEANVYFPVLDQQLTIRAPLHATEMAGRIDVFVNVKGSGKASQAGAVSLGISRALREMRPDLEHILRVGDFLTRDARMVERKKYGHKKARKSFQFSKR
jgi:small subunit ribosomal protein S9